MPRNSSGVYSLPLPPVIPLTDITAEWGNSTTIDIGQGITQSLDRLGRGAMSAPLKLASGTVAAPGLAFETAPTVGLFDDRANQYTGWANSGLAQWLSRPGQFAFLAPNVGMVGTLTLGRQTSLNPFAALDFTSTTKGLKLPTLTSSQKYTIPNAVGMFVYDTDLKVLSYNDGALWQGVGNPDNPNVGPQGPQGPPGPEGPDGPVGPQGIQGEQGLTGLATVMVMDFGVTKVPADLPVGGLIPINWDSPGSPTVAYQMKVGESMIYIGPDGPGYVAEDLYLFVGPGDVSGWENVGKLEGPQGIQGPVGPVGPPGPNNGLYPDGTGAYGTWPIDITGHAALDVPLSGNVEMTSDLGVNSTEPVFFVNTSAQSGQEGGFAFLANHLTRWFLSKTSAAESSGNAGSNFAIERFNDAGNRIDAPLSINRATAAAVFLGQVTAPTFIGVLTGHASLDLPLTGGVLSGNLTAPTFIGALTGHASLDLPLTGGVLSGNLTAPTFIGNLTAALFTGTWQELGVPANQINFEFSALYPAVDITLNLGSAALRYKEAFVARLTATYFTGAWQEFGVPTNQINFGASALYPVVDAALNLGGSSNRYAQVHAVAFNGNLNGVASNATLAASAAVVNNSAQPNITSVGTLTSLAVSGAATASSFNGLLATANVSQFTNNAGYITSVPSNFVSAEQPCPTVINVTALPHGFGAVPNSACGVLRCVITEGGWTVGSEIVLAPFAAVIDRDCQVSMNATNVIFIWQSSSGSKPPAIYNTSGVGFNVTPANWRLVLKAVR